MFDIVKSLKETVDELVHFAQDNLLPGKSGKLEDTDGKTWLDRQFEELEGTIDEAKEKVSEVKRSVRQSARELSEDAKEAIKNAREKSQRLAETIDEESREAMENIKEFYEEKKKTLEDADIKSCEPSDASSNTLQCPLGESSDKKLVRQEMDDLIKSKTHPLVYKTASVSGTKTKVIDQKLQEYDKLVQHYSTKHPLEEAREIAKDKLLGEYSISIIVALEVLKDGKDNVGHAFIEIDYPSECEVDLAQVNSTKKFKKGGVIAPGWYPTNRWDLTQVEDWFAGDHGIIQDDKSYTTIKSYDVAKKTYRVYLSDLEKALEVVKRYNTNYEESYSLINQCAHFAVDVVAASGHNAPEKLYEISAPAFLFDNIVEAGGIAYRT